jgi:tetratricopeptide (TPR) repeat protein
LTGRRPGPRAIRGRRGPVLILGTIWPEHCDTLTADADSGTAFDPHAQARALLDGHAVAVPNEFPPQQVTALRASASLDPRLAEAAARAEDGQLTQYLAAGPALLQRYQTAPPAARALIEVAMDVRRLGHGVQIPLLLLEAAVPGYLTRSQWDRLGDDWLEQALGYTAASCKGARGPLTRIRKLPADASSRQPVYRLADYLEQYAWTTRAAHRLPQTLWQACATHAAAPDCIRLGLAARLRNDFDAAITCYAAAASAGDASAAAEAADMLRDQGRTDEALPWYQRAADAGNPTATWAAARMLRWEGRTEEALSWYQRAAAGGAPIPIWGVARMLHQAGRSHEVAALSTGHAPWGPAGPVEPTI